MTEYNVHTALSCFIGHERISEHQLTQYLKRVHLYNVTLQMLVEDGWLEFHENDDRYSGNTEFLDDGYYTLTTKAKEELRH